MNKIINVTLIFISFMTILLCVSCSINEDTPIEKIHLHKLTKTTIAPTCEDDGYDLLSCECGYYQKTNFVDATGHNFLDGHDEHYYYGLCTNGCGKYYLPVTNEIVDQFVLTFNTDDGMYFSDIISLYDSTIDYLTSLDDYDEALHSYDEDSSIMIEYNSFMDEYYNVIFVDYLTYLFDQYDIAHLYNVITQSEEAFKDFVEISDSLSNYETWQIDVMKAIYESKFRDYFFNEANGFTKNDIIDAVNMFYTDYSAISTLTSRCSEIIAMCGTLSQEEKMSDYFSSLVYEYTSLSNQYVSLFKDEGGTSIYSNYLDYCYPNNYSRTYSYQEVLEVVPFVKDFFKSCFSILENEKIRVKEEVSSLSNEQYDLYYNIFGKDSLENPYSLSIIGDYFEYLDSHNDSDVKFSSSFDTLLSKKTNFTGLYPVSFQKMIKGFPIIYIGSDCYGAITLVHELGHYIFSSYSIDLVNNVPLIHDIAEMNSQGNQLLFAYYIYKYVDETIGSILAYDLFHNLAYVLADAFTITEFEALLYESDANNNPIDPTTYDSVYSAILEDFGLTDYVQAYNWRYLYLDYSGYYISYVMSLLPCVIMYIEAVEQGEEAAISDLIKTFTWVKNDNYEETTYMDIMKDMNMDTPLDGNIYEYLKEYIIKTFDKE